MSIGMAKFYSSGVVTVVVYGAFITPESALQTNLSPGAATSVLITGNVTGGVGPFTFDWARVSGSVYTINSPTSINTTFTTSGAAGQEREGVYRFTVTDTGNGNAQETADINIRFEFSGTPS